MQILENSMIVYPVNYKIAERKKNGWLFHGTAIFYREASGEVDLNDIQSLWGISYRQLAIALLVINGGREGYYLADLRDKKYWYCGDRIENVQAKLHELGSGRPDPFE
jgi:hypothetical protein